MSSAAVTTEQRDGNLEIANIKYRISPTESLVGYGYLSNIDQLGYGNAWFGAGALNNAGVPNINADQSNKIFGLRLDGTRPFSPNFRAHYTAEYAKQSDYADGDKRIDAHYYKIGGGLGFDNFNFRVDQELLSSNDNQYAFQTPFGTNHLFQGWVDKFLATPRSGIKDTFVTATYKWDDFLFFADYHFINSDEDFNTVGGGTTTNGDKYGKEWNVAATWNIDKNWMTKVEYGKFTEDDRFAATPNVANNVAGNRGRFHDTEKLWLTAMYTFWIDLKMHEKKLMLCKPHGYWLTEHLFWCCSCIWINSAFFGVYAPFWFAHSRGARFMVHRYQLKSSII